MKERVEQRMIKQTVLMYFYINWVKIELRKKGILCKIVFSLLLTIPFSARTLFLQRKQQQPSWEKLLADKCLWNAHIELFIAHITFSNAHIEFFIAHINFSNAHIQLFHSSFLHSSDFISITFLLTNHQLQK